MDLRDQQVRLDQWEIGAILDPLAHLVSRVYLELQGKKEQRVILVLPAQQVKTALPDQEASLESEVYLALWGLTA